MSQVRGKNVRRLCSTRAIHASSANIPNAQMRQSYEALTEVRAVNTPAARSGSIVSSSFPSKTARRATYGRSVDSPVREVGGLHLSRARASLNDLRLYASRAQFLRPRLVICRPMHHLRRVHDRCSSQYGRNEEREACENTWSRVDCHYG